MTRKISPETAIQDFQKILEHVRCSHDTYVIEEPGQPQVEIRTIATPPKESERQRQARFKAAEMYELHQREFAGRSEDEEEEIERIIQEERDAAYQERLLKLQTKK